MSLRVRLIRALAISAAVLAAAILFGVWAGYERITPDLLRHDPIARAVFFRVRLPRVALAAITGASLSVVGAALQAHFRNPLADPFTLGVSGGGALGASVAIALGWGASALGVPVVFVASFAGAMAAVLIVYRIARSGVIVLPGALLLAGVIVNMIAAAGVLVLVYVTQSNRALEILRWTAGSLDAVGFDIVWRMAVVLTPAWLVLFTFARDLHLLAMDEETAAALGVNVRRTEIAVYFLSSVIVGVTVAVGGTIAFVGLIVPHAARLLFGQDLRIVLPSSFLAGAAFLIVADAIARIAVPSTELPVGAVTALLGGPFFLWLLTRRQRNSAM
ncbi:MAG TPA: iron ABC transporter permease [Bryobacteraceae bacterium]|jgi:iron complex transport system permease protein|nr:iron ABC transporter permease [Bryobacteraceae bacterium]